MAQCDLKRAQGLCVVAQSRGPVRAGNPLRPRGPKIAHGRAKSHARQPIDPHAAGGGRTGSRAAEAPSVGQARGASLGTIHTQPATPKTLTIAASRNAAGKPKVPASSPASAGAITPARLPTAF